MQNKSLCINILSPTLLKHMTEYYTHCSVLAFFTKQYVLGIIPYPRRQCSPLLPVTPEYPVVYESI